MTAPEKLKLFTTVHYNLHMAKAWSDEMKHGGIITVEQASELLRRLRTATAMCETYERVMRGIEPPKTD